MRNRLWQEKKTHILEENVLRETLDVYKRRIQARCANQARENHKAQPVSAAAEEIAAGKKEHCPSAGSA